MNCCVHFPFAVPDAPPLNVHGYAQSTTLIVVSWNPPPIIYINGVIAYYVTNVKETETGRSWTIFAVDTTVHIGALHPYYNYETRVAAHTIGVGPFSDAITVRTLAAGNLVCHM